MVLYGTLRSRTCIFLISNYLKFEGVFKYVYKQWSRICVRKQELGRYGGFLSFFQNSCVRC